MIDYKRLAKAETHPLRLLILALIDGSKTPMSPKTLHVKLRSPLSTVSYHVVELAKAGMIELVKTEPRRGAVEHFYRVAK